MITTRKEALDDFLNWVAEGGDSVARDLAERALNRAVLAIWLKRAWTQFRALAPYEFTTTPGVRAYVLPRQFGRMSTQDGSIRNLTRGTRLYPADQPGLDEIDATAGTSLEQPGSPKLYLINSTSPVTVQPAAGGEACEVVSSSGGDVAVRVYIDGFDASGVSARAQVTLTGTSPVAVGTWSRIVEFGKSYPEGTDPTTELQSSEGAVTLRTTGGTVLQTLAPDEAAVDLPVLTLYPKPDAAETYAIPYLAAPRRMLHDADPLPRFWGNAVFEEMQVQWRVNGGDLASDAQVPRPHLVDLIALENANRVPVTRYRRPFGG